MRSALPTLIILLACVAACGDDEVSYSAPVGIKLSLASGDVDNGQLLDEKNINTESGNPYGAYITAAREELGGHDPGDIRLDHLTLQLDTTSSGVTTLADVFAGAVAIEFVMSGTDLV